MESKHIIHHLKSLVKQVGAFQLSEINNIQADNIEHKELNSLVSYVDKQSEKMIVDSLRTITPNCGFITEEETIQNKLKPLTWVIDPLDGTTNYLHRIPHFSISIALQDTGQTKIGMVYIPSLDECFYAVKNEGAFLNGVPITTNIKKPLSECLIGTGFPYRNDYDMDSRLETVKYWLMQSRGIRRMGSAAMDLVYVACGRLDIYYEATLNIWDLAAGALIAEEAGARVSDMDGSNNQLQSGNILACNSDLYDHVLEIIKEAY